MRNLLFIIILLSTYQVFGQIDYSKLIIGRTTGSKTLHNGVIVDIWGFAETLGEQIDIPGPTIELIEGDSVEIDFWNLSQGMPHTIHLHGLDVNQDNDGVPALSFEVYHMDHGFYKFKAPHAGTYIYHCHVTSTIHVQAGMYGSIIVRPPNGSENQTWAGGETYDRDFLWTASEIDLTWHTPTIMNHVHDTVNPQPMYIPSTYTPQFFFVDGRSGTQLTDPNNYYTAAENDKVYMRLVNIGYYGVRYIFPSSVGARTISSDGRPLPTEFINDTIEVLPGERYGTMIQLGTDPLYPVTVEHFNLNTQVIESSQSVTIRTSAAGLNDGKIEELSIYPNPSKDGVFVSSSSFENDYNVYSIDGTLVYSGNNQLIDLSSESKGIYILNYQGKQFKLIKQ